MVFGVFRDFRRQSACAGGAHIGTERAHDRSGTGCLGEYARRQAKHHGGRRCHVEKMSSIHGDPQIGSIQDRAQFSLLTNA
jgi:hypothetical protein